MNLPVSRLKLSEEFLQFAASLGGPTVPLSKIAEFIAFRGHSVFLVFFSFPFMLPIPVPGLSIIFGIIIAISGLRISIGKPPWLPQSFLNREVSTEKARSLFVGASRVLVQIEKFTKPRLTAIFQTFWFKPLDGALLILMGVLLALPLPPGTNFPPALSILCMGLGMLEKDGLFILLSYFFFVLNILVFGAIAFLGYEGVVRLIQ